MQFDGNRRQPDGFQNQCIDCRRAYAFDQAYYEGIWPECGVHRHDYCAALAEDLIRRYGKCRILDIGTGCGYLVKCLRELGAWAFGLEVSEYALTNRCTPLVRRGDVLAMPFLDKSFDVVHSQGLWEYIPEEDVQLAWGECKRVGRIQHHNYDAAENLQGRPQDQPVTVMPREWWESQFVL